LEKASLRIPPLLKNLQLPLRINTVLFIDDLIVMKEQKAV
jgi:hypothetical protein